MGVLPLAFDEGVDWRTLGMDGSEVIDLPDLAGIGVLSASLRDPPQRRQHDRDRC